jgi:tetratricopeptide (TPR) repeat protein
VRHALSICDKYFGPGSPISGGALNVLGYTLMQAGRYGEAETTMINALKVNATGSNTFNVGVSLVDLGLLYRFMGQYRKAEGVLRKAVDFDLKTLGADNHVTIVNDVVLAQVIRASGRPVEAEPVARQALAASQLRLESAIQSHLGICLDGTRRIAARTGQVCRGGSAVPRSDRRFGQVHGTEQHRCVRL